MHPVQVNKKEVKRFWFAFQFNFSLLLLANKKQAGGWSLSLGVDVT